MIRAAGFLVAVAVLVEWLAESFAAADAWPLRFAGMLAALAAAALYAATGAEQHLDDRDDDVELPAGRIPAARLLDRERRGDQHAREACEQASQQPFPDGVRAGRVRAHWRTEP